MDARARLVSLSLRDFRNFERLQLELPADGLVIVGDNGQGKTNLLEAVYYLSLLRSVRGARDVDLVRFGQDSFVIDAAVRAPEQYRVVIGFDRPGRRKRVRRDGDVVTPLSDALGALPVVMFSPSDVELVTGSPAARRRFLDIMLALSSRAYLTALQHYRGALQRRNAALRDALRRPGAAAGIEVWDEPLARHGAVLWHARRAWVADAAGRFAERCAAIGEAGAPELRYQSGLDADGVDAEEALRRSLAARRSADLRFGLTQTGPHRDNLLLLLDGRELRVFGSAGQQRTAAISLRTLEAETLRAARGLAPVFLLDDPFAELDAGRSARVLDLLATVGIGQTILAVPRESDIPGSFTSLDRRRVAEGRIS